MMLQNLDLQLTTLVLIQERPAKLSTLAKTKVSMLLVPASPPQIVVVVSPVDGMSKLF